MKPKQIRTDTMRQEIMEPLSGSAVTCYQNRFSPQTYQYIDWHWHVEFQLCLVTEGCVTWSVGEKRVTISRGNGIFINSQQIHTARPAGENDAAFFCLDIRPDLFGDFGGAGGGLYEKYAAPVLAETGLACLSLSADIAEEAAVLEQLRHLDQTFREQQVGFELELMGSVYVLWKHLFIALGSSGEYLLCRTDDRRHEHGATRKAEQSKADGKTERLKTLFLFLQRHYKEKLTLDEIAESVYLSRSECCRFFRRQTGQSLFSYLIGYRIGKSLALLENTDLTAAQIAAEVGFSSQSYYTKCFRAQMGCTPREYREKQKALGEKALGEAE